MDNDHTSLPHTYVLKGGDDPRALYDAEWLLTNGIGGFAMGTALGVPRRKYHTLLNAAANPPVDRIATVTSLDEVLIAEGHALPLVEPIQSPAGPAADAAGHLKRFEKSPTTATWVYQTTNARITKRLRLSRRNACAVMYTIEAHRPLRIEITPRVSLRDFHEVRSEGDPPIVAQPVDRGVRLTSGKHTIAIQSDSAAFEPRDVPPLALFYDLEASRGLPDSESVAAPGVFTLEIAPSNNPTRYTIAIALAPDEPDLTLFDDDDSTSHIAGVISRAVKANPDLIGLEPLIAASDDFLVLRTVGDKPLMSIIAGYPWFADWGRDTMIALPGLMLTTGRFEDARSCLETFARNVSEGMIPNRFDDYGGPPHYNTVDASLWFLHAAAEYLRVTGDRAGFDSALRDACFEIIDGYQRGTRYGIHMDPEDGLIVAGDETTQLTWMDAKRDGVVFTPRHGKAVEIQALWRHGLLSIADCIADAEPRRADDYRSLGERVRESFIEKFIGGPRGGLHDCLRAVSGGSRGGEEEPGRAVFQSTGECRPNQIFAASLEHSPLNSSQRRAVVACVHENHLTPAGLRTLAPGSTNYQARFEGDMMARDNAYHNGTVWPWLIGPYAEGVLRASGFSEEACAEADAVIAPLIASMSAGCVGQITEVCDGDEPRRQEGCTAQAWSVAEVLRIAALLRERRAGVGRD